MFFRLAAHTVHGSTSPLEQSLKQRPHFLCTAVHEVKLAFRTLLRYCAWVFCLSRGLWRLSQACSVRGFVSHPDP